MSENGKGDSRRPSSVSRTDFEASWQRIFGGPTTFTHAEIVFAQRNAVDIARLRHLHNEVPNARP